MRREIACRPGGRAPSGSTAPVTAAGVGWRSSAAASVASHPAPGAQLAQIVKIFEGRNFVGSYIQNDHIRAT